MGFYTTEDLELAKEWSAGQNAIKSFVNEYSLDLCDLKILDFEKDEYGTLNWMATLVANRVFAVKRTILRDGKEFLIQNYNVDLAKYDIM